MLFISSCLATFTFSIPTFTAIFAFGAYCTDLDVQRSLPRQDASNVTTYCIYPVANASIARGLATIFSDACVQDSYVSIIGDNHPPSSVRDSDYCTTDQLPCSHERVNPHLRTRCGAVSPILIYRSDQPIKQSQSELPTLSRLRQPFIPPARYKCYRILE